jgi:hypothetical protein
MRCKDKCKALESQDGVDTVYSHTKDVNFESRSSE